MLVFRQLAILICAVSALLGSCDARPDSAGQAPLPGPGLSYGGIPYGSVSGNVAEYFRQGPSIGHGLNFDDNYAPIEQYL